ncbi:MAG: hypothetical protein AB7N70_05165 [Dehalococcoidia bacterium]
MQLPLPLTSGDDTRDLDAIWCRYWACEGEALLLLGWPDVETIPRLDRWLWRKGVIVTRDEWTGLMRLVVTRKRAERRRRDADAAANDGAGAPLTRGG